MATHSSAHPVASSTQPGSSSGGGLTRTEMPAGAGGLAVNGANSGFPGNGGGMGENQGVMGTPLRLSPALTRMPVALSVAVPVRDFRVRHLLALAPGEVIASSWGYGEDLPLTSGDVQLAWSEFEVVDTLLAVRVTRLA